MAVRIQAEPGRQREIHSAGQLPGYDRCEIVRGTVEREQICGAEAAVNSGQFGV